MLCVKLASVFKKLDAVAALSEKPFLEMIAGVPIGELHERFVRKRTLVKYQSQSEVIKVML